MTAAFDEHADSYREQVNASVSLAGQDVDYFARRKADCLVDLTSRLLGDPLGVRALDVGCGVGVTDGHLVGRVGHLHGVDVSADAVTVAAAANPSVDYQAQDGSSLPLADGAVDLAFAICVLHHVEPGERADFAAQLRRVVRPGGLVSVFEHNPYNPLTRLAVSRCEFDEDAVLLSRGEVSGLLTTAGLELVERRYILFTTLSGPWASRIDRPLRQLPLGAQHYVVARRPPA